MNGTGDDRDPSGDDEGGDSDQHPQLTPWQVFSSTLSAAFGVQSRRNRERDFGRGKATHFIVAGIAFTVLFVLVMVLIVNLALVGSR